MTGTPIWGSTGWSHAGWKPADAAASPQVMADSAREHVFSPAVPDGKFWVLRTCSMSTNYPGWASFMIEHLVNTNATQSYHYHCIAREWALGTPVLCVPSGDLRCDPIMAGERLGFRCLGTTPTTPDANGNPLPCGIFGVWSGLEYDLADFDRVMGRAAESGTSPSEPPPDFSDVRTFLEQAAANITSAAQAVP